MWCDFGIIAMGLWTDTQHVPFRTMYVSISDTYITLKLSHCMTSCTFVTLVHVKRSRLGMCYEMERLSRRWG